MYHAQTFSGSRYIELRSSDFYFGALILYALFAAMFIPYLYILSQIWANSNSLHCNRVESSNRFVKVKLNFQLLFTNQDNLNNNIGTTHNGPNNFINRPNTRLSTPVAIFTRNPSKSIWSKKSSKHFSVKKTTRRKLPSHRPNNLVCQWHQNITNTKI